MRNRMTQPPVDPYDTEAWLEFYADNPGFRRSVGAAGVNDDTDNGDTTGDDTLGGEGDDTLESQNGDDTLESQNGDDTLESQSGDDDKNKTTDKPTDKEAELLRDMMKWKQAAKEKEKALKQYEGVDPEEYNTLKQQAQEAERKKLEDQGEYQKILDQVNEQNEAKLGELNTVIEEKDATIQQLQGQIQELTVGSNFSQSSFINEKTVLPPNKARAYYGEHFDVEDGQVVPYDKPRGQEGRTPLVDGKGAPLGFEAAIEKIIKNDPDGDKLLRAQMKPGSDSAPSRAKPEPEPQKPKTTVDKIKEGLTDMTFDDTPNIPGVGR